MVGGASATTRAGVLYRNKPMVGELSATTRAGVFGGGMEAGARHPQGWLRCRVGMV
jgi:hypothetical protein